MSNLLINIKELVSFYVKINYEEYLKEKKIDKIAEENIKGIIETLFDEKKEHLQDFIKNTLKDILKEEYPGNEQIDLIFGEILEDKGYCITKITTEIKIYQKNK